MIKSLNSGYYLCTWRVKVTISPHQTMLHRNAHNCKLFDRLQVNFWAAIWNTDQQKLLIIFVQLCNLCAAIWNIDQQKLLIIFVQVLYLSILHVNKRSKNCIIDYDRIPVFNYSILLSFHHIKSFSILQSKVLCSHVGMTSGVSRESFTSITFIFIHPKNVSYVW